MAIQAVRGMRDLFGEEMERWRRVETVARRVFAQFGYSEIRTPALEKLAVFAEGVGEATDIVEKQMYVLGEELGGGGDKLALRPEGTASFIRCVLEHQLHRLPDAQRYFYFLPMYRHERPQKGRLRQFYQFGGELINDASAEADAEMIVLLDHFYRELGLEQYVIKLNSVGDRDCRPRYRDVLRSYLEPKLPEMCGQCQKRYERAPLRVLDCKEERCQPVIQKAPLLLDHLNEACRDHHAAVKKRLKAYGIAFEEDPYIVRGLDYYSKTAFEFESDLLGAQSALVGGGRYDGLALRFGEKQPVPAVGFALGMERLMLALETSGKLPSAERRPVAFLAPLGEAAFDLLYSLSLTLKRAGCWVEMNYASKSLKAQLKHANRSGARLTVILGEEELKAKQAVLREMDSSSQESVSLESLEQVLLDRGNGQK